MSLNVFTKSVSFDAIYGCVKFQPVDLSIFMGGLCTLENDCLSFGKIKRGCKNVKKGRQSRPICGNRRRSDRRWAGRKPSGKVMH